MRLQDEPAGAEAGDKPVADAAAPLLVLDDVTMRIRDRKLLAHTSWTIRRGEQWTVLGPNGSGKSTLARTVAGELPSAGGHIRLAEGERIALVSFEAQAELYGREVALDAARHFSGREDDVLTPRRLLSKHAHEKAGSGAVAAELLAIDHLLDRPFRHLSAGEMRKTLIARAVVQNPTLLLLDEPFDGLDGRSRQALAHYLEKLMSAGRHIILVTHRADEILAGMTHVLMLRDGAVVGAGPRSAMLDATRLEELYGSAASAAANRDLARGPGAAQSERAVRPEASGTGEPLVQFRKVTVRYTDVVVLRDLDWQLRSGERWGIVGPNGSGKSTILSLIVGDNLQGYSNEIRLFGRRKGSGESVWELKRRIGMVSPHLQLGYRSSVSGFEVVLSGLFDSVGLYRRPSEAEAAAAKRWLEKLGLSDLAERHFTRLSYGQRRLLLIARAMVKEPRLLILDEPCQGLDPGNRRRVLDAVDAACTGETSLIYVTHLGDELPEVLTHILRLSGPGERASVETLAG